MRTSKKTYQTVIGPVVTPKGKKVTFQRTDNSLDARLRYGQKVLWEGRDDLAGSVVWRPLFDDALIDRLPGTDVDAQDGEG